MKGFYKLITLILIIVIIFYFSYRNYERNQYKTTILNAFKSTYEIVLQLQTEKADTSKYCYLKSFCIVSDWKGKKKVDWTAFNKFINCANNKIKQVPFYFLDSLSVHKNKHLLQIETINRLDAVFYHIKTLKSAHKNLNINLTHKQLPLKDSINTFDENYCVKKYYKLLFSQYDDAVFDVKRNIRNAIIELDTNSFTWLENIENKH